jgi:hypothetical protein
LIFEYTRRIPATSQAEGACKSDCELDAMARHNGCPELLIAYPLKRILRHHDGAPQVRSFNGLVVWVTGRSRSGRVSH